MARHLIIKSVATDVPSVLHTLTRDVFLCVTADTIGPVGDARRRAGDRVMVFVAAHTFLLAPVLFTLGHTVVSKPLVQVA